MSAASESNGRVEPAEGGASVLANLPRTRPQRTTARRSAARRTGAGAAAVSEAQGGEGGAPAQASPAPARKPRSRRRPRPSDAVPRAPVAPAPTQPKARATRTRARPAKAHEQVPRQGYETEDDRATGAVSPPGGVELVSTAVEALSELAKASLSGGERLLRDVLSRLPR